MARIKINDLPKDMKISKEDMRKITGGALSTGIQSGLRVSLTQTSDLAAGSRAISGIGQMKTGEFGIFMVDAGSVGVVDHNQDCPAGL